MIVSVPSIAYILLSKMSQVSVLKYKVIFVLGGPGAGKGTQCANIAREYGFAHLSAGDLLREERHRPGSQYGEIIEGHMKNGTIVPVEITCKLIEIAMKNSQTNKFVIDGYPRSKENLEGWKKVMEEIVELLFVIYLDCPENVCIQRCLQRGVEGSGRPDDNKETIKKRIRTFYSDSLPIVDHYKVLGLVKTLDACKSKEEVFNDIKAIFDRI